MTRVRYPHSAGRLDGATIAGHFAFTPRVVEDDHWPPPPSPASFDFVVTTPHRFVLTDGDRQAICDGSTTWFIEGSEAVFTGGRRASIPRRLREMLFPTRELWAAIVESQAGGQGVARADHVLHIAVELTRASGTSILTSAAVTDPNEAAFGWTGPQRAAVPEHSTAYVSVVVPHGLPGGSTPASGRLEVDHDGLVAYGEAGPRSTFDQVLAWARSRSARVIVLIDHPDETRAHYSAGSSPVPAMPTWPRTT